MLYIEELWKDYWEEYYLQGSTCKTKLIIISPLGLLRIFPHVHVSLINHVWCVELCYNY